MKIDTNEISVKAEAKYENIDIKPEGINKEASGRPVLDVDHPQSSGKEAFGRSLDAALEFLWKRVKNDLNINYDSDLSVRRAASYYGAIDKAISDIVTSDVTASIDDDYMQEFERIRSAINNKHADVLSHVLVKHARPAEDECVVCGDVLFDGKCVACDGGTLVKEAAPSPANFLEDGFIGGIAADIVNYVVSSGMNLNDGIAIAKASFELTAREEYRLRKYLNYMGMNAPQMIWLPPQETKFS